MVEKEDVAVFECKVEAFPFDDDTVRWSLPDHPGGPHGWDNKKEVVVSLANKTSTLRIHFANRFDSGRVVCTADNGVEGKLAQKSSRLIVNRKHINFDFM